MFDSYDLVKLCNKHNVPFQFYDICDAIDLGDEFYMDLYMFAQEEMPYGVQKARDGDPHSWLIDKVAEILDV